MSATPTPGPWTVETVPTACGVSHKVGPFPGKREGDKPRHACLYADYPSKGNPADDELEANARLIASAPDLLAALRLIEHATAPSHDDGVHHEAAHEIAVAAIAKATGAPA